MQIARCSYIVTYLFLLIAASFALPNVQYFSVDSAHERGSTLSKRDNSLDEPVEVTVNLQQSLSTISDHFIGVTIDMAMVKNNWETLDFNSGKVQNMARALTPTFFRLGGGAADAVTYVLDDHYYQLDAPPPPSSLDFNMTAVQWEAVNEFARTVGWDFIMDLNALKRNADGSWNPDNARQLLQFSADRNYTIAGFEMGNEYGHFEKKFNKTLTAAQLAKDVVALQKLLAEFPSYYSSFIIGPETENSTEEYFQGFLAAGGYKSVRAASFHHYYFGSLAGRLSNFTQIKVLNSLALHIDDVMRQARSVDPQLPLWMSETSSASKGGVRGVSDRFVAGFLWLDKLGLCASKGIQTVLRQDFYGASYPLVDSDLNPTPDFWLTVLYKRIVRGAVFNATGRHDVRVYAACANTDSFNAGSLVIYTLNPNSHAVTFDLPQFQRQPRLLYSLTAGDSDGLLSKFTSLNGVKLELVNDELPDLKPESAPPGVVTVAPYSFTFLVFPAARVSICLH
ncbi:heparanase-like [Littorina saxatilis]|uniref:heparanase-like n=1 Tax=Littorina saxatilis TaxID=31220 RepID=UPI0038B5EB2E